MKIIITILCLLNISISATNFSSYFDLRIGNIFVYDCGNNYWEEQSGNCTGHFKLRIVITDTINYAGQKYFHYSQQLVQISGTCSFFTWMFPFNVGNYSTIWLDTIYGRVYYYNPTSGCNGKTMLDSLNAKLHDTVTIRCVQSPYFYICTDTVNKKKFYSTGTSQGEIIREYDRNEGLVDNYNWYNPVPYISQSDSERLLGSVINGIVYGDTSFPLVGIKPVSDIIPTQFSLSQNYPNPFNPTTKIKFDIPPSPSERGLGVRLIIYDILGREVATLVNEELKPGSYEYEWDGSNFASGVYFYKLSVTGGATEFTETKRMVLLK